MSIRVVAIKKLFPKKKKKKKEISTLTELQPKRDLVTAYITT